MLTEPTLTDAQGRSFRNLRVSLTAACNYACNYCVPKGKQLHRARHELDTGQFLRALGYLVEVAGIDHHSGVEFESVELVHGGLSKANI